MMLKEFKTRKYLSDTSVSQSLDSLPSNVNSGEQFLPGLSYRVGPSLGKMRQIYKHNFS